MTPETRLLMQANDSVDTVEISRLKKLFWDLENMHRQYSTMPVEPTQEWITDVVPILAEYANRHHQPSINQVFPRAPLPTDTEGRLDNGEILKQSLSANQDPSVRVSERNIRWMKGGSTTRPDTRVLRFDSTGRTLDTNGQPLRDHDD